jgi:hypothetical protein
VEYDSWTRKLIKIVEEWGFTKGPNISGSHTKWTYKGPKAEREFSIIIPRHNKSGIRAKTIGRIKQSMRAAGVTGADLEAFNKLALGLMQAQPHDDFDDLEEKLEAAMAANRILIAAEIALEIGKRAGAKGQMDYKSRAIDDARARNTAAANIEIIRRQIDQLLLKQVQMMMRSHFASGEDFTVSRGGTFAADSMSELPLELYETYGVNFTTCEADEDSATIQAIFTGDADGEFAKQHGMLRFRVNLSLELDDDYASTEDSRDFYSVLTYLPQGRTLEELEALHRAIDSVVKMTILKKKH